MRVQNLEDQFKQFDTLFPQVVRDTAAASKCKHLHVRPKIAVIRQTDARGVAVINGNVTLQMGPTVLQCSSPKIIGAIVDAFDDDVQRKVREFVDFIPVSLDCCRMCSVCEEQTEQ